MKKVGIIDFGSGNIFSVQRALADAGSESSLISSADQMVNFGALVLPGVGAFGPAMEKLKGLGLIQPLQKWVKEGKPLLGVCLGLQLLMDSSEEFGMHQGLGIIPGKVSRFPSDYKGKQLRVPHMGWEEIHFNQKQHDALNGVPEGSDMYFVHSYFVELSDPSLELTWTEYNGLRYTSSIAKENVWAFQFHPEKSASLGIMIYRNWIEKFVK